MNRSERDRAFARVWAEAVEAGRAEAEAAKARAEVTMVVAVGHENPLDDNSRETYRSAPFPICGFAWVTVRPGNSAFARWLKREGHANKAYGGGLSHWVRGYGQSYDLKYAFARGMAKSLRDNADVTGTDRVYADGRLD